ncbi:hypothetical protein Fcan01_07094 [Folsomia candida]|uniref:Uncharacterized protein n=1 Tax=Folsomia candida TaxID=158441 RepID=A0A226EIZ9_FOLCA|nr:hypothetical protein Fcan01_07094 [Folsomia candida]
MGYEESLRKVRIIAILDIVFSTFPLLFYTLFTFIFGFVVLVGYFNSGYVFLDWILANTMTIQEVAVDFDNPGQAADLRMFRCSVWGIAILFNLIELTLAFFLLHAMRRSKTEQPFAAITFVMFILIIALLSTGSQFVGLMLSIAFLIYRGVAFWMVYKHVKNIRDLGGVP